METTKIALFRGKEIRKILDTGEWWFSVLDVVSVLTDSSNPRDYWYKMKIRVQTDDGVELSTFCRQLKLESADGKMYETDCANTEGIFRIIQSIIYAVLTNFPAHPPQTTLLAGSPHSEQR
ncbi:MAG: Bro-N domain-containing protein [Candidatus Peribacteraceae bacterium]|nr:Bro-N domain-containing protein [Candidatus Peribacteraceae bacterium]